MTHIEIHKTLDNLDNMLDSFYEQECVGSKDSVRCLLFSVVMYIQGSVGTCMAILEEEERFCPACFHLNLDTARKTIHRYLLIETELDKKSHEYLLLKGTQTAINKICISMAENDFNTADTNCAKISNTAFGVLNNLN